VFFRQPTPAPQVRAWALQVLKRAGNPQPVEVYPKQDHIPEGGLGNLVRVPFGVHRVYGGRSRVEFGTFARIAAPAPDSQPDGGKPNAHAKPKDPDDDHPIVLLAKGVGEGEGRNNVMFRAMRFLYWAGFSDRHVYALASALNEVGCKPPLDEAEMERTFKSASAYERR
jgi:hypothetical protein